MGPLEPRRDELPLDERGETPHPADPAHTGHVVQRALRVLMVIITVGLYFVLSPFGYVLCAAVLLVPTRDPGRRARRLQAIVRVAFRALFAWASLVRILHRDTWRCARKTLDLPPGAAVIVANHPTLTDPVMVGAVVPNLSMVAKPIVYRRALIRPLLRGLGYVNGASQDPLSMQRLLDEARGVLEQGMRFLVFPEGTRSPPEGVHPFGRAAFEIACRSRVPLISVLLRSEPRWLWRGAGFMRPPHPASRLSLKVLKHYDPAAFGFDSRALRLAVEGDYRRALTPPDEGPPGPQQETTT